MAKVSNRNSLQDIIKNYKKKHPGEDVSPGDFVVDERGNVTYQKGYGAAYNANRPNEFSPANPSGSGSGGSSGSPIDNTSPVTPAPATPPTATPPPATTPPPSTGVTPPPTDGTPPPTAVDPNPPTTVDEFAGFNPDVAKGILDTYNTARTQFDQDVSGNYNAAANRLRERIGSVANQQRGTVTNNFVGRGIGSSPILQSSEALGGINNAEQEAVTGGLVDLDSVFADRKMKSLGLLNDATANALGLGQSQADYEKFTNDFALDYQRFLQDGSEFDEEMEFKRGDSAANRENELKLARLVNSGKVPGELMGLLQTLLSQL